MPWHKPRLTDQRLIPPRTTNSKEAVPKPALVIIIVGDLRLIVVIRAVTPECIVLRGVAF